MSQDDCDVFCLESNHLGKNFKDGKSGVVWSGSACNVSAWRKRGSCHNDYDLGI